MQKFPYSGSSDLQDYKINIINPTYKETTGVLQDSEFPYVLNQGIHIGTFDPIIYKQGFINGVNGIGINPVGLYGVQEDLLGNVPKFLLAAKNVTGNGEWGDIVAGEFRVGDDVKEDNGALTGNNWLWYNPNRGLEISGPLLRSTSSGINIIQSPTFDIPTEFTMTSNVVIDNNGYDGGSGVHFTGDGLLTAKGYKTIDGATTVRGSILYYASTNFIGTVSITATCYDIDKTELTKATSVINIQKGLWKRHTYVVRIDTPNTDTFELSVVMHSYTAGEIFLDNWNAYRVFQSGFTSADLPEIVPDSRGVVIDRQGIRGFTSIAGVLEKRFEVSATDGSAFLAGSLFIRGYLHTGTLYDASNVEIVPGTSIGTYWSGCGVNEYGIYGINATISGGAHVSSVSKFLLGATDLTYDSADYYWGTDIVQGEFRVGDNVKKISSTTLAGDNYIWYDGDSTFRMEGIGLNVGSDGYVWVGTSPSVDLTNAEGCGIYSGGISAHNLSTHKPVFVVSAAVIGGAYWTDALEAGEFRLGSDVTSLTTTGFRYLPSTGKVQLTGTTGTLQDLNASGSHTNLTGGITLIDGAGLVAFNGAYWTGLNYTGFAAGEIVGSALENTYMVCNHTDMKDSAGVSLAIGEFRVGKGVHNLTTSTDYMHYHPTSGLTIKLAGDDVIDLIDDAGTTADWDGITDNLPAFLEASQTGGSIVTGLNATDSYFGYYNSGWKVKIASNGEFYAGDGGTTYGTNKFVYWDTSDLIISGEIYALSGRISGNFYVGSSSSGIKLDGDANTTYIPSYTSGGGTDPTGWAIYNDGRAYLSSIRSAQEYLVVSAYNTSSDYSKLDLFNLASYNGFVLSAYDGTNSGRIHAYTEDGGYLELNATGYINIGRLITPEINLLQSSSGILTLGRDSGTLAFFEESGSTQQAITDTGSDGVVPLWNYAWNASNTASQSSADIAAIGLTVNSILQILYNYGLVSNSVAFTDM